MAEVIKLEQPIKLESGQEVDEITITDTMKQAGALRGLKMYDVMMSDVDSLFKLLPRVTSPRLSERDLMQLPPYVFHELAKGVAVFLVPPSQVEMTIELEE
ncbi:phage tail assembly protein [Providencia manganoxydans]|uniref:phage tail assembly protein n=1 Tax=Providencia manganoxydans TaxID=2923283 RepID=UPI0034E5B86B